MAKHTNPMSSSACDELMLIRNQYYDQTISFRCDNHIFVSQNSADYNITQNNHSRINTVQAHT